MPESGHTLGPWHAIDTQHRRSTIEDADGKHDCGLA